MHRFEVWAPAADRVEVVLGDGRRVPMHDDDGGERSRAGWRAVSVDGTRPGDRYAFSLDGGPPRPDPRSPSQPAGPDGPSCLVDHAAFAWSDAGWRGVHLPSAVVYELHVGTFSGAGTFDAVIDRLDHLVDLGVDVVELLPVGEFPGERGWGYDGVDLYAPHHSYGGPDGLKRLVDACHRRGLGVALDVVYNHLGPSGNYLAEFGPYFSERHSTPWGMAVNLDGPGSHEVRRFFVDNALMWLRDYHVDGLRIDAVHAIVDTSAVHFLEQLAGETAALAAATGRPRFLVAESDLNDPRVVTPPSAGGYGIDAQWSDDFHHALHALLTGERRGYYADFGSVADLATALRQAFVYDGRYSPHRDRIHGRRPRDLPGWAFLGYLQNHDQVGNRATGERSGALMSPGRLKVAAALVLTAPFVPLLFQGEEWGASTPWQYFTDHPDPELGRAVSAGRRAEFASFGWRPEDVPDPQDAATFRRSRLDWSEPARKPHAELLDWHRRLIELRRTLPWLTDGRLDAVTVRHGDPGWLAVERGPVTVACNLGAAAARVPLTGRPDRVLAASEPGCRVAGGRAEVPPDAVVLLGP